MPTERPTLSTGVAVSLDRYSGLFFAILGLLLFFVIIPYDTEVVDYGWVRPQTVPNSMAWLLVITGVSLVIRPGEDAPFDLHRSLRAGLFLAILGGGLFLIDRFGFVAVAPGLALLIMVLIGERRPLWLILGTVGLPLLIWFTVAILLQRPLP